MTQPPITPGTPQQPYGPPQPQVVHKPGGLSSTAHAVHILACLLTFGLWIPGYILCALFAPSRRTEVIVPVGADPRAVQAAYAATQTTPAERREHNRTVLILVGVFLVVLVPCLGWVFTR